MNVLALLLDGPPSDWMFVRLLLLCLGVPLVTILASYALIRRRRLGILWCLAIAVFGGWGILTAANALINFGYPYEPNWLVRWGPVLAATAPFCAIVICMTARKEPAVRHCRRPFNGQRG